ncbi:hypothetical protein NUACC26_086970 [Scytonema sp. NUACC26]
MNQNTAIEQLKNELKRLVSNNVNVKTSGNNYLITIQDTEISVPRINNQVVRKNRLRSK